MQKRMPRRGRQARTANAVAVTAAAWLLGKTQACTLERRLSFFRESALFPVT
jgi:hypothetical protein